MYCTYEQGKFTFSQTCKIADNDYVIVCVEKDDFNLYTNEQFCATVSIIKEGLEHSKNISRYARAILSSAYQQYVKNNTIDFEGWMTTQLTENIYEIIILPTHIRIVGKSAKGKLKHENGIIDKMLSDIRNFLREL